MIDIHSHILPGIDDGAKNLDMAFDMLRLAIAAGVTTQVLTPHIHLGTFENSKQDIEQRFKVFKKQVKAAKLPIKLLISAEVRIGPEVMQLVVNDAIPYLGEYRGKRTFLLEFPPNDVPHGSINLINWLLNKHYLPVIVHPERNRTFSVRKEKLQALIDLGCPIQITAGSLLGRFGKEAYQIAEELLLADKVSVIASDSHNVTSRAPDLQSGYQAAVELVGQSRASRLVTENPQALTNNNPGL